MRRTEMRTAAVLLAIIITGCGSIESAPPTSKAPAAKADEGGAKASKIRPAEERPIAPTEEAILEAAGPKETCALDVPAAATQAFVMVYGYDASRYDLSATHTPAGR